VIQKFELRVLWTKNLNPASEMSYTVSRERRRFAVESYLLNSHLAAALRTPINLPIRKEKAIPNCLRLRR
jgi:hypothetical protein